MIVKNEKPLFSIQIPELLNDLKENHNMLRLTAPEVMA